MRVDSLDGKKYRSGRWEMAGDGAEKEEREGKLEGITGGGCEEGNRGCD